MSNELATYIADKNAKTIAWVNEGEGRFATTLVEDLNHWAEYGVHTPLQLDWYLNLSCVVDMHKDAYGFKGSWMEMPTTDAELRAQIEEMDKQIERLAEEMKEQIKAEEEQIEYQRQLAGEHTAAVKEALKPSAPFTIGDMFPA